MKESPTGNETVINMTGDTIMSEKMTYKDAQRIEAYIGIKLRFINKIEDDLRESIYNLVYFKVWLILGYKTHGDFYKKSKHTKRYKGKYAYFMRLCQIATYEIQLGLTPGEFSVNALYALKDAESIGIDKVWNAVVENARVHDRKVTKTLVKATIEELSTVEAPSPPKKKASASKNSTSKSKASSKRDSNRLDDDADEFDERDGYRTERHFSEENSRVTAEQVYDEIIHTFDDEGIIDALISLTEEEPEVIDVVLEMLLQLKQEEWEKLNEMLWTNAEAA